MKLKTLAFFVIVFAILSACNSKEEKMATIPPADDKVLIVQHPIADYDKWKAVFDGHDSARIAYGFTTIGIGKGIDDPNDVLIVFRIQDEAKAKEFMNLPNLQEVMDSAGVTALPTANFVHAVRNDTSKTDIQDRLMVKHRVKDFDAWLKVYDDEGMETRKSHGLIDRALGRGMEDSNMVYIVFAVSDWDKANARNQSEDLKNLMTDAGVEGPPTFIKYRFISQQ